MKGGITRRFYTILKTIKNIRTSLHQPTNSVSKETDDLSRQSGKEVVYADSSRHNAIEKADHNIDALLDKPSGGITNPSNDLTENTTDPSKDRTVKLL